MRRLLVYALILTAFGLGVSLTLEQGRKLPILQTVVPSLPLSAPGADSVPGVEPSDSLVENLRENLQDPLTRLFVQLILIIVVARLCGAVTMTIRQPAVIGEMIAGILLGPSLLGWLWPDVFHFVFPASSLGSLRLFSQIGVCLFMFVVGMELDLSQLKQQAQRAVLVSQMSILVPFLMGMVSALFLFSTFAVTPDLRGHERRHGLVHSRFGGGDCESQERCLSRVQYRSCAVICRRDVVLDQTTFAALDGPIITN
jgi:hypothetical protein